MKITFLILVIFFFFIQFNGNYYPERIYQKFKIYNYVGIYGFNGKTWDRFVVINNKKLIIFYKRFSQIKYGL